jgi:hypothetical protein
VLRLPGTIKDVGAKSLSLLRRHGHIARIGHDGVRECREVDSSTGPRARAPSERSKTGEPCADETVGTPLNTNGADRVGARMQIAKQQPPAIADVDRHPPLPGHNGAVSFTKAT